MITCSQTPAVELCADRTAWDAYVEAAAGGSSYHRWVWREVIHATYGHRAYYLIARMDGAVQGVLPLIEIRSRLFGHVLVSMPFSSYGGVLAANNSAQMALLNHAEELARDLNARSIELRQPLVCEMPWIKRTPKVTFYVDIPANLDNLWNELSSDMRKKIRRARKHGLRVEWSGREATDTFYRVFSTNMRDLGTPAYPRKWFENICAFLPDEAQFVTLWDEKVAVASGIILAFRDTVELPWSGSSLHSRKKFAPSLMFWSVFEWAAAHGYTRVDLGRCTPGSGTYEFKSHFPATEKVLNWYYWLSSGAAVPELRPDNPRYRWATRVWKHLPLDIANSIGPHIVRSIP